MATTQTGVRGRNETSRKSMGYASETLLWLLTSFSLPIEGTASLGTLGVKKYRILILMHEADERSGYGPFAIDLLARLWEQDGHRVTRVYGTRRFIPGDVVIVHVDLSVVPDAYMEFAMRYPVAINGQLRDVRKSVISRQLVGPRDGYDGPVIVKTDRNYGGIPEKVRQHPGLFDKALRAIDRKLRGIRGMYRVYEHPRLVPSELFRDPDYVVERFLPELDQVGNYCLRTHIFLCKRSTSLLLRAREPVVSAANACSVEMVEEHPDIAQLQQQLHIEYGKLDYVVHDGRLTLLDVNKTVGVSPPALDVDGLENQRRHRAEGLYELLAERL